jgi:hypothetical protein
MVHQSLGSFGWGDVAMTTLARRPCFIGVVALCAVFRAGPPAAAQSCGSFCEDSLGNSLFPEYKNGGCAIEVCALLGSYNSCGAALPGHLELCLFKNAPSANGGVQVQCIGVGGCRFDGGRSCGTFTPWPSPGTTNFFVEAWVDIGDSNPLRACPYQVVSPVRLPAVPPGDSDGDGVDDCADNCPNVPNPLQVDVDQDGKGDVCDSTKGDLNGDGHVDGTDLEIFLTCLGGDGVQSPPPGCDQASFEKADLDGDFDVDFVDLRAFQVFFGQ